ncbi:unnamed protein product [Nippostrongylus brasiliensis]|uniref:Chitin-binding type-2 domain-containing protein n=1 Tax=Nippostrongylus brasiliensis TaxID=27835 RepID=A0A158R2D8_NIPBR|nr:unnamed protein product [Nippostrongylus brasiliensis]
MRAGFILLTVWLGFERADGDVVFTRERCDRAQFGLQPVRGQPARYRQCGPNGRVWIVPCVPGAIFDPLNKVCRDISAASPTQFHRRGGDTRRRPAEQSTPITEEFIFSTRRPKRPRPTGGDRPYSATPQNPSTPPSPLLTTVTTTLSFSEPVSLPQTTPQPLLPLPTVAYTPSFSPTPRRTLGTTPRHYSPSFNAPSRGAWVSSTAIPNTLPTLPTPLVTQGHLYPQAYQAIPVSEMHISGAYPNVYSTGNALPHPPPEAIQPVGILAQPASPPNVETMSEDEFLGQVLRLVKAHQVAFNSVQQGQENSVLNSSEPGTVVQERQNFEAEPVDNLKQTNEIDKQFELERIRMEKQKQHQLAHYAEMKRQKELEELQRRQQLVWQAEERKRKEREELERQRRVEENARRIGEEMLRQQQITQQMEENHRREREEAERRQRIVLEMEEKKRKEREEMERQRQIAENKRLEMEELERQRRIDEQQRVERERLEKQQERARLLKEKERETLRQQEIARVMKNRQEKERKDREKYLEMARQIEEKRRKTKEEKERQRKVAQQKEEKQIKERTEQERLWQQKAEEQQKEQQRLEAEWVRQQEQQRRLEEAMRSAQTNLISSNGPLYPAERSRGLGDGTGTEVFSTNLNPPNPPSPPMAEIPGWHEVPDRQLTAAPDVIHFTPAPSTTPSSPVQSTSTTTTTAQPWRPAPDPQTNQPQWFETSTMEAPTKVISGCTPGGDCMFSYDQDLLCAHPSDASRYLQCTPMIGRRGRWTERSCPPSLPETTTLPYLSQKTLIIPRLPTETDIARWQGNRELLPSEVKPAVAAPPPPASIYETIESFPPDLLPQLTWDRISSVHLESRDAEYDETFVDPPFPRVQPQFASPFAKQRDSEDGFFGTVIKPVIKKVIFF